MHITKITTYLNFKLLYTASSGNFTKIYSIGKIIYKGTKS